MGIFGKLMSKIGEKMEKSMSKNLTGDSAKLYQEEKEANQAIINEKLEQEKKYEENLNTFKTSYSKNDMKNLEQLLEKINVLDEKKIWVGGFDNFKTNQNAKAANLFSGNKNIKILSANNDTYYLCKFDNESFYAYKLFTKDEVLKVEVEGMLSKKIKLTFKDGKNYSVDISENKDKATQFKNLF